MNYSEDIKKDGEIRRLKTKCKHASEVLKQIDGAIRDWVESVREYLNQED